MFRKKLSGPDILLIAANLFPVFGVWFLGWNATEAFIVYAMETLIVGILTVVKLLIATFARGKDDWYANGGSSRQSGLFFILFFVLHFGIFAAVQTTIFSQSAGITPANSGAMHFFFKWYTYINKEIGYMLCAFIVSYIAKSFIPFIINNDYKTMPMMVIMFQPYGRIFIQQFTVILGSMFLSLGIDKAFILIFALAKTFFELSIDYDKLMDKAVSDIKKKSSKK